MTTPAPVDVVGPAPAPGAGPEGGWSGSEPDLVAHLDPRSLLGRFNRSGVLAAGDVHVARALARLCGEGDEAAVLGAALAVRAPRVGHVYVDLSGIRHSAAAGDDAGTDLESLPWPDPETWRSVMAASPLVTSDPVSDPGHPLVISGTALYLERLWRDETGVAAALVRRAAAGIVGGGRDDDAAMAEADVPFFGTERPPAQRRAAATVLRRRLAVVAGGPGTGKTTTVARALAALFVEAARSGGRPPLAALAAPTGKAAARLADAVRAEAASLDLDEPVRAQLQSLEAFTLHRLLGSLPGSASRFRHDSGNPLPHDVVVVDETSMLPLWLMARLVEAVRADARLVLIGDPEQLASVEAGVVLADVVGPARLGDGAPAPVDDPTTAAAAPTPAPITSVASAGGADGRAMARCVVNLSTNYRFTGTLAALAEAVRAGDAEGALAVLGAGHPQVVWCPDPTGSSPDAAGVASEAASGHARRLVDAAREAGAEQALEELGRFRLLCAHRRGPAGAQTWNDHVERLVRADASLGAGSGFYVGLPLIVTANDYGLRLFNGDVGVVVPRPDGGLSVAFRRGQETVTVSPMALSAVSSVYAITIHKAQGSEFDEVAVVLPEPSSRILTRELLYTAITRARHRLHVVGSEEAVGAGVERRVARASGLMARLWGSSERAQP